MNLLSTIQQKSKTIAEIYSLDGGNTGGNDAATLLAASALAGNGGGWGGFGNNPLAMAFMFPFIMPFVMPFMNMMYGNGWGGFGGNNGGAGFISNQLNNDAGRQLIMQAVQGNASAIDRLAQVLNTTHDQIQEGICSLNTSILNVGNNVGMTGMQIINAMQSGNASLQSNIAQGLAGILAQMNANSKDEAMAHCQQTYSITDTINRGFLGLDNKIDALESARKDREITALTAKVAQLESQGFTQAVIGQALAPINAQLAGIRSEVDSVKCKLPETMTLPNTQYTIVPAWRSQIGADIIGSAIANRFFPSQSDAATTPTTPATATTAK